MHHSRGWRLSVRAALLVLLSVALSCAEEQSSPSFDPRGAAGNGEHAVASESAALSTPACVGVAGLQSGSPWPMRSLCPLHRGQSPYIGAQSATLAWSSNLSGPVHTSPAVAADGTIYAGNNNLISPKLYAVNPNGSIKWTYNASSGFESSPAIGSDGTIYIGNNSGRLQAFNPSNGSLKWSYTGLLGITSSPAIGTDGTIYVGTLGLSLTALRPDGSVKWIYPHGPIAASPAIAADGTIYVGGDDLTLHALNPSGTVKWTRLLGAFVRSSPSIANDGTIYVGADTGKLYAINPNDGSIRWSVQTGGLVRGSPTIASDGTLYVGSDDKKVYAINANGTVKWSRLTGGVVETTAAIGNDGLIYVGSDDKKLYALKPADGSVLFTVTSGSIVRGSPAIAKDGTVYFGSDDAKLYAVGPGPLQCTPTSTTDTTCNGIDDNCNGQKDEGYVSQPTTCGVGACARSGSKTCVAGVEQNSCVPGAPAANDATCNGIDEDCSGAADEDYLTTATSCGTSQCSGTGQKACQSGHEVDSCAPPSTCEASCSDGIDNDNDTKKDCTDTDCSNQPACKLGTKCLQTSECSALLGTERCLTEASLGVPGGYCSISCGASDPQGPGCPAGSTCTNNDFCAPPCNAQGGCINAGDRCVTGVGCVPKCQHNSDCASGRYCAADGKCSACQATDTSCDGIDQNCNGTADEGYTSTNISCGVGACTASGTTSCVSGSVVNHCTPGTPAATDATCNGVDDNCNGAIDDGYIGQGTTCGTGACARTGTSICIGGSVQNGCVAGTPAANDATCNGVDDNCNGSIDEDFAAMSTSCGVGACGRTGTVTCASGAVVNSCVPGTPAATDATCNGVDDNCNGAVDEGYVAVGTSCGVGACARTGTAACVGGTVQNTCVPGSPAAGDTTCNGVDDNCNGQIDEGFVSTQTSCTNGGCLAHGQLQCSGGATTDSCASSGTCYAEANCSDNVDNDSDGVKDCLDSDCTSNSACSNTVPDPRTVAPAANLTHFASTYELTQFLFNGSNPVQPGVTAGAILPQRISIVRGRVLNPSGSPLPGVTVSVVSHPELGHTLSRNDGQFDLAINGGQDRRLSFSFAGCPSVQRPVRAQWERFTQLDDVVMTPLDTAATAIDLSNTTSIQVARGSAHTDADGPRRVTLLFPPSLTAQMVMPSGTTQALTHMTVRATEFSVGSLGKAAMPAALPPHASYAFAAELSVDEAMSAGATSVRFGTPVPAYLENFLGMPVGSAVPAGSYDPAVGIWNPMDNGLVIAVTGINAGLADLDTDGDGAADTALVLTGLGITSAERATLASLYTPGQTLWRVPLKHFTSISYSWPSTSTGQSQPGVAMAASSYPPARGALIDSSDKSPNRPLDKPTKRHKKSVRVENGSLSEDVPIAGTPFKLNYTSERTREGVSRGLRFKIQVGLDTPPDPAPIRIDVEVLVAGRTLTQTATIDTDTVTIDWDGKNAYDQQVSGATTAGIQVCYAFGAQYNPVPRTITTAFGVPAASSPSPSIAGAGHSTRPDVTVCNSYQEQVTPYLSTGFGPDGWMLSAQDIFDATGRSEILGNGQQISARGRALGYAIKDILIAQPGAEVFDLDNTGFSGFVQLWDGGFIMVHKNDVPYHFLPNNNAFVADPTNYWVQNWNSQPAPLPGPGGTIYMHEVARLSGGGVRDEVRRYSLDQADKLLQLGQVVATGFNPQASTSDGRLYGLTGAQGQQVAQITPDGTPNPTPKVIYTEPSIATDNTNTVSVGTHAAGTLVRSNWLTTAGEDGTTYLVEQWRLTGGLNGTVFGQLLAFPPSGGSVQLLSNAQYEATNPDTDPNDNTGVTAIAIDPTTNQVVLAAGLRGKIVGVEDGALVPIVGKNFTSSLEPTDPTIMWKVDHMAFGADGLLYFTESYLGIREAKLRRVEPSFPGKSLSDTSYQLPSPDGSKVFHFDGSGQLQDSRATGSNDLLYSFSYTQGFLTGLTDRYGNNTRIDRASDGTLLQIVAPFGQTTTIGTDSLGRITRVTAPDQTFSAFTYSANTSLLASMSNPRGDTSHFTFDADARLLSSSDAAGGGMTLDWSHSATNPVVTTAGGVVRDYNFDHDDSGLDRSVTFADGTQATSSESASGDTTLGMDDGTDTTSTQTADPIWGMARPYISQQTLAQPSGLTSTTSMSRSATPLSASNPFGASSWSETRIVNGRSYQRSYNASTRVLTSTSPQGRVTTSMQAASGLQLTTTAPGRAVQVTTYDSKGRPSATSQNDGTTQRSLTYGFDAASGYGTTITGPVPSETVSVISDVFGRALSKHRADGALTAYGLDAVGQMLSINPPGRPAHRMTYTPVSMIESYSAPNTGGTGLVQLMGYSYTLDYDTRHIESADGQNVDFTYQPSGKLDTLTTSRGTAHYTYDATSGHLTTITDVDGGQLTLGYDGSLTTGITWGGDSARVQGVVGVGYDSNFWVTGYTVNGAQIVSYGHDNDGLVTSASGLSIARDAASGDIVSTTLGTSLTTTEGMNKFAELDSYTAKFATSTLFNEQVTQRDPAGRISDRTETVFGVSHTYHYGYDSAGRLTDVGIDGASSAHYDYDPNGNRLARTTSSGSIAGSYDAADRLTAYGSTSYVVGPSGNLLSKTQSGQTTSYSYDPFTNLRAVSLPDGRQIEYEIDAQNRRIGKKVNGLRAYGLLYTDQLRPVAQIDASNAVIATFVYATRTNVPDYMVRGSQIYRFIIDHLGSVRLVVNAADGSVTQRLEYDEFGNVLVDTNPGFQPFGFAGGIYDTETGLVRFGARDYDAVTGRWTAKDPLIFGGGDTNLYAYVGNDPVDRIDINGMRPLSDTEEAFLDYYFGDGLDTSAIDVGENLGSSRAWSPYGDRISLPSGDFMGGDESHEINLGDPDIASTFAHEAMHVLQRQNGEWVTTEGAFLQIGNTLGINDPYSYTPSSDPGDIFREFASGNVEQQGQIFQDFVYTDLTGGDTSPYALVRDLIDPVE